MNSAAYALAVIFWAGLAAGSIIFLLAWRKVKDLEDYREAKAKLRPGIISFFHGKAGVVTDILLTAALAVTIAGNYSRKIPYPVSVGGMFVFLLTLFLHLVVGGRVWTFAHGQKAAGDRETGLTGPCAGSGQGPRLPGAGLAIQANGQGGRALYTRQGIFRPPHAEALKPGRPVHPKAVWLRQTGIRQTSALCTKGSASGLRKNPAWPLVPKGGQAGGQGQPLVCTGMDTTCLF